MEESNLHDENEVLEDPFELILKAIDHISHYTTSIEISTNIREISPQISTIADYILDINCDDKMCNTLLEKRFHLILIDLIKYFSEICSALKPIQFPGLSDDMIENSSVLEKVQGILNTSLVVFPIEFKISLFKGGIHKYLLDMLNNDTFTENFKDDYTLKFIIMNIWLLGVDTDNFKNEWNELKAADTLIKVGLNNKKYELDAYGSFAIISTDNEINSLSNIHYIMKLFSDLLKQAAIEISENTEVDRFTMEFKEDNEVKKYDVFTVGVGDTDYFLTNILNVLYRLAVNNTVKYELFASHNVGESVKTLIFKGSEIEVRHSLNLLAQLCFDKNVADTVSKDDALINYLESLSEKCSIKASKNLCKQILWSVHRSNESSSSIKIASVENDQQQVMISYNTGSRDLCLKIKNELENAGYKVWIDVNEICGSSLASMANAVESSQFILMCVTEKYRQSVNCQAEAQYSFKLNKPIVPLVMQKGYENIGGWLGMIMSDRIYINFMKFAFEEAMQRLLNQLSLMNSKIYGKISNAPQSNSEQKIDKKPLKSEKETHSALKWNEEDVLIWFKSNDCMKIYDRTRPTNGKLLYELHQIQSNAPEFFYQLISLNKTAEDISSMLKFSSELKNIFKS